jgi:prepilin-type N-terminal cleavage/methylation domain-containing protein
MKKNGFSLIELLVVISIIGVLTAVLMMNLVGARERSRDAQKIQALNSIKSALRMYYNDNQSYPSSLSVLATGTSYVSGLGDTTGWTYTLLNGSDSFRLTVGLEVGAGNEDENSQIRCGLTPTPGVYAVCAN